MSPNKKFFDLLKRPAVVRVQVIVYLMVARFFWSLEKSCEEAQQSRQEFSSQRRPHRRRHRASSESETSDSELGELVAPRNQNLVDKELKFQAEVGERYNYKKHLEAVKFRRLVEVYQYISTSYMVYVLAKNLLPLDWLLVQIVGPTSRPAHCYLPGRFVFGPQVSEEMASLFCALHLGWRFVQYQSRARMSTLLMFLLTGEEEMRDSRKLIDQDFAIRDSDEKFQYHRRILSYPVNDEAYSSYRTRANRTQTSRLSLEEHLARSSQVILVFFSLLVLVVGFVITYISTSNYGYATFYPNCEPSITKESIESYSVWPRWSFSFTSHRLLMIPFDSLENIIIWFDSGCALLFVLPLAHLLNYDLIIYWRSPRRKLENLLAHLRCLAGNKFLATKDVTFFPESVAQIRRLEHEIRDIQAELTDFFQQLKQVDLIVSDIITMGAIIWLAIFCMSTYLLVTVRADGINMELTRLLQYFGCTTVTATSFMLLSLHRRVASSYRLLCSIIALDNSRLRLKFLVILEHYTDLNHTSYSLMRQYPFKPVNFLSIVSWTFSCLFIVESLTRQARGTLGITRT